MDRRARIDAALARHGYSPILIERVERLLDGLEDRTRLRCCNSGCFVCVQKLLAILDEVEGGSATTAACAKEPPTPADAG